jgi:hypothetical protein
MIASLVSDDYDLYVDGHGQPRTAADFAQLAEDHRVGVNGAQ